MVASSGLCTVTMCFPLNKLCLQAGKTSQMDSATFDQMVQAKRARWIVQPSTRWFVQPWSRSKVQARCGRANFQNQQALFCIRITSVHAQVLKQRSRRATDVCRHAV